MSRFICYKCGADCPSTDPPTAYCGDCVRAIRESVKLAGRRLVSEGRTVFADGAPLAKAHKPVTITVSGRSLCGLCGSVNLSPEYGHCVYGCGSSVRCEDCSAILDFREDDGT